MEVTFSAKEKRRIEKLPFCITKILNFIATLN